MIELKPAQVSDCTAIAKLHAKSWQQHYRGILSDSFLDHEVERERLEVWNKRFSAPIINQKVTVAVQRGNIVGFSCVYLDDDPVFGSLLDNLHVSSNYQRSGIGRLLMQNCARIILDNADIKKMYLWVFESNHNARKVYERLGGTNFQTIEKQHEDGTKANVCRYVWEDLSRLT